MFFIIGLGLSDEKDVTLRGLEVSSFIDYELKG
jgi:diphthamide biosynthesis methyltransferase